MGSSGGFNPLGSVVNTAADLLTQGSREAARGAGRAAMEQQRIAQEQRKEAMTMTEPVTLAALANYDKAIAAQESDLARQEKLVSQIDPAILEASQQVLALLQGKEASSLSPLKKQRELQRQKLLDQLRQQLGSGAESSTLGMQALNRFDTETSNILSGAQTQAIGNLTSVFGQFNQGRPNFGQYATTLGSLASNQQALRLNQLQALNPSNQNVFGTAGAQFTEETLRGQGKQNLMNTLVESGAKLGSAYFTGGA